MVTTCSIRHRYLHPAHFVEIHRMETSMPDASIHSIVRIPSIFEGFKGSEVRLDSIGRSKRSGPTRAVPVGKDHRLHSSPADKLLSFLRFRSTGFEERKVFYQLPRVPRNRTVPRFKTTPFRRRPFLCPTVPKEFHPVFDTCQLIRARIML